jgi:hypothetical protein
MKKYIFRVNVEVTHMEGSLLPEYCAGAFVNVYLAADNIREAVDMAEKELLDDLYKPVETTSAYQIDKEDYDKEYEEEGDPKSNDLENIHKNGGVWYAAFHTYPPDEMEIQ